MHDTRDLVGHGLGNAGHVREMGPRVADDWREVAQAAAALMAAGEYTTVAYAVRTAREIVAEARKVPEGAA
jgi:hypothetical protein